MQNTNLGRKSNIIHYANFPKQAIKIAKSGSPPAISGGLSAWPPISLKRDDSPEEGEPVRSVGSQT